MSGKLYEYYCPDCRTTNNLHDRHCDLTGVQRSDIEKAYIDILSVLTGIPNHHPTKETLRDMVHGEWDMVHERVLQSLVMRKYIAVDESGEAETYRHRDRDEYEELVKIPGYEPLTKVYDYGSVPGCHDNAIFALVAWYEYVGFNWDKTRALVIEWLRSSGTWKRGGFAEDSPEEVVEQKQHVHEQGYGFQEKADAAYTVIQDQQQTV